MIIKSEDNNYYQKNYFLVQGMLFLYQFFGKDISRLIDYFEKLNYIWQKG